MIPLAAIMKIGEKVLDKVLPDPAAKAAALAELEKIKSEGRLAELNADNIEAQELTKRQEADMKSDSWLSKNIRPMTLIFILGAYFTFAMMSAFGSNANEKYVELLAQWGMLVMSFYFGGRTLEKIMDMKAKQNATNN
jgi:cation transport ATPase